LKVIILVGFISFPLVHYMCSDFSNNGHLLQTVEARRLKI